MQDIFTGIGIGVLVAVVGYFAWRLGRRGRKKSAPPVATYESFVTSMRAVGDLSVFRIMTKEVITASEHWFGEFGRKYLNWLLTEQKITLIVEFDVDFRYDLTDPRFEVKRTGEERYRFTLPPCRHEVLIRNIRFHSEDKPELMPWLMPDLLGRFFTGGFSVEAKNKLIAETRDEAGRFARELVGKAHIEAQNSAARTLSMLAQGLGAWSVDVAFSPDEKFQPRIDASALEKNFVLPHPNHGEE